ncbi:MAG: nucleoside-diphosphate-sugar pyrophosphorylase, partial [Candidatus Nanosalina sp. J07AB43]
MFGVNWTNVKAVVLCAGKGRRIRDITDGEIPKPMIEVDGAPILEYTLSSLESQNIDEVLINLHHKGGVIEKYFGSTYGSMDIKYFWEESLRGTSGSLAQMKDNLN